MKRIVNLIAAMLVAFAAYGQTPVNQSVITMTVVSSKVDINLPHENSRVLTIDWGDGIKEDFLNKKDSREYSHTYSKSSTYKITITGVNITGLGCSKQYLTSLDVSKCPTLEGLFCSENFLTSLDVSKNTVLTMLSCGGNQLTSLDVSKNTALKELNCYNNQLTSLDVSKNTALTYLDCRSNQLTSLDVSKNTALTEGNLNYDKDKVKLIK